MNRDSSNGLITIFIPSFADENNLNAQNLTTREIVARLSPDSFRVIMLSAGTLDARIAARKNTILLPQHNHGNTLWWLFRALSYAPDVYFFPREGPLDSAFFLLRKFLHPPTSVVTYVVSGGLDTYAMPAARARNIREADAVVANSAYISHVIRHQFGIESTTVYDGVDRRFFFPSPHLPIREASTVLYAGSFRKYKRVDLVVREAAKHSNVSFRFAGDGEELQNCCGLANELGCKNVSFLGELSQSELGHEMRRADVFFFPSTLEGHPQVLLQAAACGLPVVAMNNYKPEYVIHNLTGLLSQTNEELSANLSFLLENRDRRSAMGKAAIRHAVNFDWDQIAIQWANIFHRLVTQRHTVRTQDHKRFEYS